MRDSLDYRSLVTIPRTLVLAFVSVITVGTLLLKLPGMMAPGADSLTWVDAIFMATSAVCVTGLVVRDTATQFTFTGQVILITLIQIGGLGILTLSTFFLVSRTGRLGFRSRGLVEQTTGNLPDIHPRWLIKQVFIYTFSVEAVGILLLTLRFWRDYPFLKALWHATFFAISGFCNAGFSLYSDSLTRYSDDLYVNAVMIFLIVSGGLGFVVFADLVTWVRAGAGRRSRRLSLHTRIVIRTTILLAVGGGIAFMLLEWRGTEAGEGPLTHFTRMFFLSAATRTAGFNTVETLQLTNSTLFLVIILMAIGAAPGSTAGGLKVTTAATLYYYFRSRILSRPTVEVLDRSLPQETVTKALVTTAGFFITAVVALLVLEISELRGMPHVEAHAYFFAHLFEVVSALCTVGLSMGITSELTDIGKMVIAVLMFVGRLGPIVVGSSLLGRGKPVPYSYPEESVMIG